MHQRPEDGEEHHEGESPFVQQFHRVSVPLLSENHDRQHQRQRPNHNPARILLNPARSEDARNAEPAASAVAARAADDAVDAALVESSVDKPRQSTIVTAARR